MKLTSPKFPKIIIIDKSTALNKMEPLLDKYECPFIIPSTYGSAQMNANSTMIMTAILPMDISTMNEMNPCRSQFPYNRLVYMC